ncbi:DUF2971 domain-containing protein [Marinobacter shengliensis]
MPVENQTLYHYTSQDAFRLILESKQLWMTEATALNDRTEVIHFTQTFQAMLSRGRFEFPEMEGMIKFMLENVKPERFGIVSFSRARDCLTNWRLYGADTTGLAIGFHSEGLKTIQKRVGSPRDIVLRDIPNILLEDVRYEDSPRQALIDKCLSWVPPRPKIDTRFRSIELDLIRAACCLKKTAYEVEKEVRLIKNFRDYYQEDHSLYEPDFLEQHYGFRTVDGRRRLLYKHDFLVEQVSEVILGENCSFSEDEVREMLWACGFPNSVNIDRSNHGYRTAG